MPRFHKIGEYAHSKLVYIINKVAARDSRGNYGFTDNVVLTKGKYLKWESEDSPGDNSGRIRYATWGELQVGCYSEYMGFYFHSNQANQGGGYLSLVDEGVNTSGPEFRTMNIKGGLWTTANANDDHLGSYTFAGFDDADVAINLVGDSYQFTTFANIKGYVSNITNGNETGRMTLNVMAAGTDTSAITIDGHTTSLGSGRHIITADVDLRKAHNVNDTVIAQVPGVKIPAQAIIMSTSAVIKTLSNIGTMIVNIRAHATDALAADAATSGAKEILGDNDGGNISTDTAGSRTDITMSSASGNVNKVWYMADPIRNDNNDRYIYICNVSTGNGETDPTAGTLSITIEYIGID